MAWDPRNQWQTLASRPKTRRGVAKGTVAGLAALLLGRAPVVKASCRLNNGFWRILRIKPALLRTQYI